jgi:hypothetical protein
MKRKARFVVSCFVLIVIGVMAWYEVCISNQGSPVSSLRILQRLLGWFAGGAVIVQYVGAWELKQQGKESPSGHPWLAIMFLLMSLYFLILGYNGKIDDVLHGLQGAWLIAGALAMVSLLKNLKNYFAKKSPNSEKTQ